MNSPSTFAIINAAGKGSRLGDLPYQKSLLPTKGGKPIISYALKSLYSSGFSNKNIITVVGHKRESIENYIQCNTLLAIQEILNGTGGALYSALPQIVEDTKYLLVMNGDDALSYRNEAVGELLRNHEDSGSTISISTTKTYNPNVHNNTYLDTHNGEMYRIADAKEQRGNYLTGLCIMDMQYVRDKIKTLLENTQGRKEFGITDFYKEALKEGKKIRLLTNTHAQSGINTMDDWKKSMM